MKKLIFFLILLSLTLSACAKKVEPQIQYVTKLAELPDCPRPEKLKLEKLNIEQHLGSTINVNAIDEIIISLITYNTQLEATIDCYEKRKQSNTSTKGESGDTRAN